MIKRWLSWGMDSYIGVHGWGFWCLAVVQIQKKSMYLHISLYSCLQLASHCYLLCMWEHIRPIPCIFFRFLVTLCWLNKSKWIQLHFFHVNRLKMLMDLLGSIRLCMADRVRCYLSIPLQVVILEPTLWCSRAFAFPGEWSRMHNIGIPRNTGSLNYLSSWFILDA